MESRDACGAVELIAENQRVLEEVAETLLHLKNEIEMAEESAVKHEETIKLPEKYEESGLDNGRITPDFDWEALAVDNESLLHAPKTTFAVNLLVMPQSAADNINNDDSLGSIVPFPNTLISEMEKLLKREKDKIAVDPEPVETNKTTSAKDPYISGLPNENKYIMFMKKKAESMAKNLVDVPEKEEKKVKFTQEFYKSVLRYKADKANKARILDASTDCSAPSDTDESSHEPIEVEEESSTSNKAPELECLPSSTTSGSGQKDILQVNAIDSRTEDRKPKPKSKKKSSIASPEKKTKENFKRETPEKTNRKESKRESPNKTNRKKSKKANEHNYCRRGERCKTSILKKSSKYSRLLPTPDSSDSESAPNVFDNRLKSLKKSVSFIDQATRTSRTDVAKKIRETVKRNDSSTKYTHKVARLNSTIDKITKRKKLMKKKLSGFSMTPEETVKIRQRKKTVKFVPEKNKAGNSKNWHKAGKDVFWAVDKVLKCRKNGDKREYLIKWIGEWENSWEPEENLTPKCIEEYYETEARKASDKITFGLGAGNIAKWSGFLDKRADWNQSGYARGLNPDRIQHKFLMNDKQCALVRFDGQAKMELLLLEDVLQFNADSSSEIME